MNQRIVWMLSLLMLLAGLSATSTCAFARRGTMSMGSWVRQAEVIAIADSAPGGDNGRDTIVTPREILKGDPKLLGQSITIAPSLVSDRPNLPRQAQGFAILLRAGWQGGEYPILETFVNAGEVEALRTMVRIVSLPERARLLELRERSANPIFREQLLAELRDMREPANFSILLGLAQSTDEADQKDALEIIAFIGDARGVPALIEAMKSPNRSVAITAANALMSYFPSAAGVDAAFRREPPSPQLAETIRYYKFKHGDAGAQGARTLYMRISDLRSHGDDKAAQALFAPALRDPKTLESLQRSDAAWLESMIAARPEMQPEIRRALLPTLARDAAGDNEWYAASAARVLRALHHEEADAPLLSLLDRKGDALRTYDESMRIAAFALVDRGGEARRQAIEKLRMRADWASLAPMFEPFASREREGAALIQVLEVNLRGSKIDTALNWAVYRLGELRDKRAVEILARFLVERPWYDDYLTAPALIAIGGAEVEQAMLPLLKADARTPARRNVMQVLVSLQRQKALPLLRQMLREEDLGVKSDAAQMIGSLGTKADIALLESLGDFWKGDRNNHLWIQMALSQLRQRFGYDFNGPIKALR